MPFRNSIPAGVFVNQNAEKLVKVFDELEAYKTQEIEKVMRSTKTPLHTNLEWLRKRVEDYGYPIVPYDFTKEQLDAMLLNVENVMALKGSKMGLYYWIWTLTFGNITIDDSNFFPSQDYIIPSDLLFGYVSHIVDAGDSQTLYLFGDANNFGFQVLDITIETKYWQMQSLIDYIQANIKKFISFVDSNAQINITFTPGVYTPYAEPNQFFVIP